MVYSLLFMEDSGETLGTAISKDSKLKALSHNRLAGRKALPCENY